MVAFDQIKLDLSFKMTVFEIPRWHTSRKFRSPIYICQRYRATWMMLMIDDKRLPLTGQAYYHVAYFPWPRLSFIVAHYQERTIVPLARIIIINDTRSMSTNFHYNARPYLKELSAKVHKTSSTTSGSHAVLHMQK
jgi:hypothetical protein